LVFLAVLALAGCSSQTVGPGTTTTATTSSTTTTTPVGVVGTSLLRARVAPLRRGALELPPVTEGSAAWLKMVPIAYRSFGSGPDLLLVSGQDGTVTWWGQTLLSDLSGHYRVTVFDLPGAGYSASATAHLSLAWLADMTAGFALTVGLTDPVIVGWGLGGQIALSLVERHPGFASALVLVDTAAGGAGSLKPSASVVRLLGQPAATPVALSSLLFPPTTAGLQERLTWPTTLFSGPPDWMTVASIEAQAELQATVWRTSALRTGLSGVSVPVLVASGADDIVFPSENASRLAAELPHATEVSFPGAGYGAIVQDEPEFVAAVEKFTFAEVSPTTSTTTSSTSGS
jgi:pimeloyl-ACP methyl ester carboxylesterase